MAISVSIRKKFPDFCLDMSFEETGSRLGVLGASGCGKSMTLRCIAGIEKPDSGKIVLNGRVLYDSDQKISLPPQKRRVGYLFQNYALFPNMTVEENIWAGVRGTKEEKQAASAEQIRQFRLEGLEKRYPSQLSGGQQQRVALARIMAYRPELILLDEPFSAMDSYLKDKLQQQLLVTLSAYHGDVILVTHNRDEVYKFCGRLLVMREGQKVVLGETKELFANPVKAEAARLTGCKNIAPARRLDAHTLEIGEWGVRLCLEREIGEQVRYVGIRAHDFIPRWGEMTGAGEGRSCNGVRLGEPECVELPFEKQYFLKNGVCWFLQRENQRLIGERGLPDWLEFPEEKLLLLED